MKMMKRSEPTSNDSSLKWKQIQTIRKHNFQNFIDLKTEHCEFIYATCLFVVVDDRIFSKFKIFWNVQSFEIFQIYLKEKIMLKRKIQSC